MALMLRFAALMPAGDRRNYGRRGPLGGRGFEGTLATGLTRLRCGSLRFGRALGEAGGGFFCPTPVRASAGRRCPSHPTRLRPLVGGRARLPLTIKIPLRRGSARRSGGFLKKAASDLPDTNRTSATARAPRREPFRGPDEQGRSGCARPEGRRPANPERRAARMPREASPDKGEPPEGALKPSIGAIVVLRSKENS